MKTPLITLILFFSIFFSIANAQNWHPIRVGEIYHYCKSQNVVSTNLHSIFPLLPTNNTFLNPNNWYGQNLYDYDEVLSLRIDSSSYQNGITSFHYSRYFIKCDTCSSPAVATISLKDTIYYYPQITIDANANFNLIIENDTIKLNSYPPITSIFDTIQFLNCIADSTYIDPIYGDSVIIISVYNSLLSIKKYELHLSKFYGIKQLLKYNSSSLIPIFKWIGIESQNNSVGLTRLKFADTYDFSIGDEFYYKIHEFNGQGIWWCGHIYYQQKAKVINKQVISADSILYTFEETNYQTPAQCPMPWPSNVTNTIPILYTSDFHTQCIQGELTNYGMYLGCKDLFLNDIKYIGYHFNTSPNQPLPNEYISYFLPSSNNPNIYDGYGGSTDGFAMFFEKGLGKVFEANWGFEMTFEKQLVGYIKGTDTVGIIPYPQYLGLDEINLLSPQYQITFNSTNQIIDIKTNNSSPKQTYLRLCSIDGKEILEKQIRIAKDDNYTTQIPSLPIGLYIVTLHDKDGVLAKLKISLN